MEDAVKVVAHPLMVAVAFGLLGPSALEAAPVEKASTEVNGASLDPEEVARAERLWVAARDAFDAESDEV